MNGWMRMRKENGKNRLFGVMECMDIVGGQGKETLPREWL